MRVLVMLPTYNEIENIQDVLERARAALPDADILVIDDGSPDGTAELAEKIGEVLGGVDVLRREVGPRLRVPRRLPGRPRARLRRHDRDGRRPLARPAELPELVAAVEQGADLAIGSRYVPGGSIPDWKWVRRAISRGGGLYARTMLGLSVQDATAGFRAYHRR